MTVTEPAPAAPAPGARNYMLEMMELIRSSIPEQEHRIPAIAERLVSKLRAEDPELLAGFLDERAYYFVRAAMSEYAARHRRTLPSREQRRRSVFSASAAQFAQDGDAQALRQAVSVSPFAVFRVVDGQDLRKPTGKLRGPDVTYIIDHYNAIRSSAANEAAFWRAVKRRIGDDAIEDVYTEEQFESMYSSACGKNYGD